jgi:hypothetical protein
MSSDRSAVKRGEQSLEFLFTYLEEEKRKRQQEAADSTSGQDGQGNGWNSMSMSKESGYRLHHQLRNSLRDFSYSDVPATIRNRLKESKSHRLKLRDIECEVFDWVFQHLDER